MADSDIVWISVWDNVNLNNPVGGSPEKKAARVKEESQKKILRGE